MFTMAMCIAVAQKLGQQGLQEWHTTKYLLLLWTAQQQAPHESCIPC